MEQTERRSGAIEAVLLDYGGVLAEEGFQQGLAAIATRHGYDPQALVEAGKELVYATGYVTGKVAEADFWSALRRRFPLTPDDGRLRRELLVRFRLRPGMLDLVRELRRQGLVCVLLSDQTDWLDELDHRDGFFPLFHHVYNSFRVGMSKRQPGLFDRVLDELGLKPAAALFVDDTHGHVRRAAQRGLHACLFRGEAQLRAELGPLLGLPARIAV